MPTKPTTVSLSATEAAKSFGRVLDEVRRGREVRITHYGRDIAVVVDPEYLADLQRRAAAKED